MSETPTEPAAQAPGDPSVETAAGVGADSRHIDRLDAEVQAACLALERYARARSRVSPASPASATAPADSAPPGGDGSALEAAVAWFALTPFETSVLALAAGVELFADAANLCAVAHGDPTKPFLTPALALAALPGADRAAFAPAGVLRFWQVIVLTGVEPGATLDARITVPEAVLQFLIGQPVLDARLETLVEALPDEAPPPGEQALCERIAAALASPSAPVVHLAARPNRRSQSIAAGVGRLMGLRFFHLPGDRLINDADVVAVGRLWQRDRMAMHGGLVLSLDAPSADGRGVALVARLATEADGPILVIGAALPDLADRCRRPVVRFHLPEPTFAEQSRLWRVLLGLDPEVAAPAVDALALRFRLPRSTLASCIAVARSSVADDTGDAPLDAVLAALAPLLREQAREGLAGLAQRAPVAGRIEDIVLPPQTAEVLRQIIAHHRNSTQVLTEWGFGREQGQGLSVLFAGPSGTGKTMAAEVIARELDLDLFRIDLSQVVDKYIGETEKNLGRLFDAAEASDAVLLFDEADALFGRRSAVRDSHDRYANLEVGYLLQRIEAYRGVVVLTSNLPSSIDPAFNRRLSYIVRFTFPDRAQRLEIWRRAIPAQAPTQDLDFDRLARLSVSGGQIQVLALNAAMLAADQQQPISMRHIAVAARTEFAKRETALPSSEFADWPS
jgi:hypothetical protein